MILYIELRVLVGVFRGGLRFVFNYRHLLNSLLRLEFIVLIIYYGLRLVGLIGLSDFFFTLFYLVIAVCEGVLGLSLLIARRYRHGSDYMKGFNRSRC
jgi:NADH:ubiquinone oxidoreductase subunit K